jgi:selenide,water dikinase
MKRLLLLGAGHAHLFVLEDLLFTPLRDVEVVLVNPGRNAAYSGMLPGVIAGHYHAAEATIDAAALAHRSGVRFIDDRALAIDAAARRVSLDQHGSLGFDLCSIDVGSSAQLAGISGAREHGLAVKPVEPFLAGLTALERRAERGQLERIAVIGGGAAGIEIAAALRFRFGATGPKVALVCDAPDVLAGFSGAARAAARRLLLRLGVELYCGVRVAGVSGEHVLLAEAPPLPAGAAIFATGAAAPPWFAGSGLALDSADFVRVETTLRSVSHPEVFAAGDCASVAGGTLAKAGVQAVRQGPLLAENLRRSLTGGRLLRFRPRASALVILAGGARYGIAIRDTWVLEGGWVWRWKDWIDRRFVRRFEQAAVA